MLLGGVPVAAIALVATQAGASPDSAAKRLRAGSPGATVDFDRERRIARFARTPAGLPKAAARPPADAARDLLVEFGDLFGLDEPETEVALRSVTTDALGHTHADFEQRYQGLPVFGAGARVHFDARGEVIALQGSTVPTPSVATIPTIAAAEAGALAVDAVDDAVAVVATELVIFDLGLIAKRPADPRLAFAVEVRGPSEHRTVFIDADDGAVLLPLSHRHEVLQRANYEFGYGPGFLVWQESDGPYLGGDPAMQGLIDFTEDTYDLFNNVSGGAYPSYDGASAVMEGVLNAPLDCPNAQWNGTSTNYCDGLVTDDVVAHEWAHGYTQFTQGLIYAYQPGALNESFSDIFGEAVDLLNGAGLDEPGEVRSDGSCSGDGDSVRWLIGEDTQGLGGAIRDMWSPTCNAHPGRVLDFEYFCNFGGDFFDNGGVHLNSGVPNHGFSLLVDGGSYNGEFIPSIGMTKALAIYWRVMSVYQTEVSGFADHAIALASACSDLEAAGADLPDPLTGLPSGQVIDAADCDAVDAVIAATELGADNPCGSGTLLDPDPAPAACADGSDGTTLFEDDFEDDFTGWTLTNEGVAAGYEPRDWALVGALPDLRPGSAAYAIGDQTIGGCFDDDQSGVMHLDSPEIVMPDDRGAPVVSFVHWVAAEPALDGGNLKISVFGSPFVEVPASAFVHNPYTATLDPSDNPLAGQEAFTGSDVAVPTGSWAESVVDLSLLVDPGDAVVLRFDFGVNNCNGLYGWYVDDVRLVQCAAVDGTDDGGSADADSGPVDTTTGNDTAADGVDVTGAVSTTLPPIDGADASSGSDGTDGGAGAVTDRGCACSSDASPSRSPWWLLVSLLGVQRARRRRTR